MGWVGKGREIGRRGRVRGEGAGNRKEGGCKIGAVSGSERWRRRGRGGGLSRLGRRGELAWKWGKRGRIKKSGGGGCRRDMAEGRRKEGAWKEGKGGTRKRGGEFGRRRREGGK